MTDAQLQALFRPYVREIVARAGDVRERDVLQALRVVGRLTGEQHGQAGLRTFSDTPPPPAPAPEPEDDTLIFADIPSDERPTFYASCGFTADDAERFSDYFSEDDDGYYPGDLHRYFSLNVRDFADRSHLRRKVITNKSGKKQVVWYNPNKGGADSGHVHARHEHEVAQHDREKAEREKAAQERRDAWKQAHEGRSTKEELQHRKERAEPVREAARKAYEAAKADPGKYDPAHMADVLESLTRDELREHAREVAAKLGGKKAELVARLVERLKAKAGGLGDGAGTGDTGDAKGVEGVLQIARQSTGKSRDGLDQAMSGVPGYGSIPTSDLNPLAVGRRLAIVRRSLGNRGTPDTDLRDYDAAMSAIGIETIGQRGGVEPFDPERHEASGDVHEGDPVKVTASGYELPHPEGGQYTLLRATVEKPDTVPTGDRPPEPSEPSSQNTPKNPTTGVASTQQDSKIPSSAATGTAGTTQVGGKMNLEPRHERVHKQLSKQYPQLDPKRVVEIASGVTAGTDSPNDPASYNQAVVTANREAVEVAYPTPAMPDLDAASDSQKDFAERTRNKFVRALRERMEKLELSAASARGSGAKTDRFTQEQQKLYKWIQAIAQVESAKKILDAKDLDFASVNDRIADIYEKKLGVSLAGVGDAPQA